MDAKTKIELLIMDLARQTELAMSAAADARNAADNARTKAHDAHNMATNARMTLGRLADAIKGV